MIHAIIKQESGFHISSLSKAGAIGFMQIIPSTAKLVAKENHLRYNEKALRTNPAYNILLGSKYLDMLSKQFDNSLILMTASYNAGPNAVNRWIKKNGDPRAMTNISDIVNWMELVRYSETRNYIQRIIEFAED